MYTIRVYLSWASISHIKSVQNTGDHGMLVTDNVYIKRMLRKEREDASQGAIQMET